MTTNRSVGIAAAMIIMGAHASPARADATVFVGATTEGSARPTVGVSVGRSRSFLGFEIEFARTVGQPTSANPSVTVFSVEVIVQSPEPIHGMQLYGIGGFGLFGESFENGLGGKPATRTSAAERRSQSPDR